ncbi:sugar phosphate isomerase/epimerase family protein [Haloarculaceae archaeon H-GB2-1]|nr:sugar phosphate isomerase/epimerase [Haloarculaceae archaeon H-GB1-1]MEA5387993.1 sugar phosphate isomerase/epimerase family protein [Haloarculaceae archaeon H-GB11]MEA5409483.1 sugar phosphate isomerase/epimerase family protein [Haloarculaceae archaeon H-GB2-1]
MKYAVLERTVPAELGTPETIRQAGEAGFDGIALQINGPDPSAFPVWNPEGRARIREAAVEAGVEITSVSPSFYWQGWEAQQGFLSDNQFRREEAIDALKHIIDAAGGVNADLVLIPFFQLCKIEDETDKQRVIDALGAVIGHAEHNDVTVTLETSLPASENAEIVDAVDSPAVKICYDAANKAALYGYDDVAEVRELGDRIGEYHVKDFHEPPPAFPDNYAALGEGAVDQQGVADALQDVGYDGWAVLETEMDKPLEYTMDQLAYTKELFGD